MERQMDTWFCIIQVFPEGEDMKHILENSFMFLIYKGILLFK